MTDPIEFLRQRLQMKLESINVAIQMYYGRLDSYTENRNKVGKEAKGKIIEKINSEFNKLFVVLHNKQQAVLEELNASYKTVLDKEIKLPNSEQCKTAVLNLTSCSEKVDLLLHETNRAVFFQESSKIGQEIEFNLDLLMKFQIEQFDVPCTSTVFPEFSFDLDETIFSVNSINLQPENIESIASNSSTDLDITSQPVINQLKHLSPDFNREIPETVNSPEKSSIQNECYIVPYENLTRHNKYKFVVLCVYSPSEIYLQLLTKEFNQMIPKITQYHDDVDAHPEQTEVVNFASVEPGQYFFAKYSSDNCWYRALIRSKQIDTVEVYFVDYGNTDKVSIENLRFLPEIFAALPQQAFKCILNTIIPIENDLFPSTTDETMPTYQWDKTVTNWVDVVLDAHTSVYGLINECSEENRLELEDIILSSDTLREILKCKSIALTASQWTLLDRDHIGLRELLVSGSMALETGESSQRNFYDSLSFSNSASSHAEQVIVEKATNEVVEFAEIFGKMRDENECGYYFPNVYQENGSFQCMVTFVESPECFYVHIIHTKNRIVDEIAKEILVFLAENPPGGEYQIAVRQPCIAIGDGIWFRCIVLEIDKENSIYFVFYIDFGSTASVKSHEIVPIDKRLIQFPAQAVPCRLYGIKPPNNKLLWPREAIETFNSIISDSLLTAFMTSFVTRVRTHNNVVVMEECLMKVNLYDYEKRDECLNDRLIDLGYADMLATPAQSDIAFSSISFSNSPDDLNSWDPMEAQFLSPNNNYSYQDDSIDIAMNVHKTRDISVICRFFNTLKGCQRNDCRYQHIPYPEKQTKTEIPGINDVVALPEISSFIYCQVTSIHLPDLFYITCPNGAFDLAMDIVSVGKILPKILNEKYPIEETEYYKLFNEMQEFYNSQNIPKILENWALSEIAVAKSQNQKWHRCRIIDPVAVKVFYLDYGYIETVKTENVRKIEQRFIRTPFQAIGCNLSKIKASFEDKDKAKDRIKELVSRKHFYARVDSLIPPAIRLYFTSEDEDEMEERLYGKCLNDILCQEGYFKSCESSQPFTSIVEGKKVIINMY